MKIQSIFYWISLLLISASCKSYSGKYVNEEDDTCLSKIQLNKDGSYLFHITYGHLCGNSWSYGYWEKKRDTLYFNRKILHDTLRFTKDNVDTLVLSNYPIPELKIYDTLYQHTNRTSFLKLYNTISLYSSSRQSSYIFHKAKLVIRKNRLYQLNKETDKISEDYFIIEKKTKQTLK